MVKILGIIVVFGCVLGGFILSGGKFMALIHPFEVLIIGGAALGAFLQANPGSMFMTVFKKSLSMFGTRFTHTYYLEVLKLLGITVLLALVGMEPGDGEAQIARMAERLLGYAATDVLGSDARRFDAPGVRLAGIGDLPASFFAFFPWS